eukprot:CAMPEP_0194499480 /NCGR_PEP_ID=MMETSP0253-20130528/15776_1 /TAXON_ID=2966 /ORGANISM="Noctiluca scintillans" /LENGTH=72 /DNA_ID=CAMNT_0039341235 /DNA_START=54 /DNA_END=268 /DNA_ORIENTATION=+
MELGEDFDDFPKDANWQRDEQTQDEHSGDDTSKLPVGIFNKNRSDPEHYDGACRQTRVQHICVPHLPRQEQA